MKTRNETAMTLADLAAAYDDASRAYDRAVNRGAGETQIAILRARKVAADTAHTLAARGAQVTK